MSRAVSMFKSTKGYVITTVKKCKCNNFQPTWSPSGLYCKNCHTLIKTIPTLEVVFNSMEELSSHLPDSKGMSDLRRSNDALKLELGRAEDQTKSQKLRIAELERDLQSVATERNASLQCCGDLERELKDKVRMLEEAMEQRDNALGRCAEFEKGMSEASERLEAESRSRIEAIQKQLEAEVAEKEAFKAESESLTDTLRHMDQEVRDLKDTVNHARAELQRMNAVDVRGLVSSMMVYAAVVNNTVDDGTDLDIIRSMVDARTEKLMMDLGSQGIMVSRHRNGDVLGNGRVDITDMVTDDPEQDMRVVRSNRYGASFKNCIYPEIPESVVVYRFMKDDSEEKREAE